MTTDDERIQELNAKMSLTVEEDQELKELLNKYHLILNDDE